MTVATAQGNRVSVGIGQLATATRGETSLVAYGLGSCIGLSLWDATAGIGGMVHVLLPESTGNAHSREPARFADVGVELLIAECEKLGGLKHRFQARIAGGAAVLGKANAEKFKIGERNVEAVKDRLKMAGIRLLAEDTGGTKGRTMELQMETGKTFVRLAAAQPKEL